MDSVTNECRASNCAPMMAVAIVAGAVFLGVAIYLAAEQFVPKPPEMTTIHISQHEWDMLAGRIDADLYNAMVKRYNECETKLPEKLRDKNPNGDITFYGGGYTYNNGISTVNR